MTNRDAEMGLDQEDQENQDGPEAEGRTADAPVLLYRRADGRKVLLDCAGLELVGADGTRTSLTQRECDVLKVLYDNRARGFIANQTIQDKVRLDYTSNLSRTMNKLVYAIVAKLAKAGVSEDDRHKVIENRRGVGYRFQLIDRFDCSGARYEVADTLAHEQALGSVAASSQAAGPQAQSHPAVPQVIRARQLLPETNPFAHVSWEELARISDDIGAAPTVREAMQVARAYGLLGTGGMLRGDLVKPVSYDGRIYQAQVVGIYHDRLAERDAMAGLTFMMTEPIELRAMDSRGTNKDGWGGSELRRHLNAQVADMLLDPDATDAGEQASIGVVPVRKLYRDGAPVVAGAAGASGAPADPAASDAIETADRVFFPARSEIYGAWGNGDQAFSPTSDFASDPDRDRSRDPSDDTGNEGRQYQLMRQQGVCATEAERVYYRDERFSWLANPQVRWLRTADLLYDDAYDAIRTDGAFLRGVPASQRLGVQPLFCVGR